MVAELGHFALILAFVLAMVQGTLPLVGAARREQGQDDFGWAGLARPAAIGQFLFVTLAFVSLTVSFITSDFSLKVVVANSNSALPLLYKISAVWGNHEGSMLLWVFILALFGLCVVIFGKNLPPGLRTRVLSIQGLISIGFLLFILFTSNPFLRLDPAPLDGRDLNPLLQDPGLAFHPPFLYLGYVGFSMAFSFAVAALIEGRVDPAWARWVRPWTLAAWCALTLGIGLGSWWAYYELGWGGFWFWDPVENASLIPWLAGTALLHSATVVEKRDAMKSWTVLLAILTFSLSLIGTFLVRSGVLTSVHAFATDPTRGVFILALLIIVIGGSLSLFAWRAPTLKAGGIFSPVSREGFLLLNNLLLTCAAGTVLIGTLYPLFLDAVGGDKVSVGPPFFNATFLPIAVPLVVAMVIGPLLSWKRGDLCQALGRLTIVAVLTLTCVAAILFHDRGGQPLAALGMGMAAWLFFGTGMELVQRLRLGRIPFAESRRRATHQPRAYYGMVLAHAGLAIIIAGITGGSMWRTERIQAQHIGESVEAAGYSFALTDVVAESGPNYTMDMAMIEVSRNGRLIATLTPEKRIYDVSAMPTTEAAIHSSLKGDLYVALGDQQLSDAGEEGAWTTRIWFNPLVPWIWAGSLIMVLGGLISLADRRHRIGAPRRATERAAGRRT